MIPYIDWTNSPFRDIYDVSWNFVENTPITIIDTNGTVYKDIVTSRRNCTREIIYDLVYRSI